MKKRHLLILFLIVFFAVLQSTALNYIQILKVKPDILIILTVFSSLTFGQIYGLTVGALCGVFTEATCGIPTGVTVLVYSFGGLILGFVGRWVYNQTTLGDICITFIFSFSIYLLLFFFLRALNIELSLAGTLGCIILPACFYTACVSPLLFRFLRFLHNLQL